MSKMSVTGNIPEDVMARFYVAIAITEGLLAVADAVALQYKMVRGPKKDNNKQ